MFAVSGASWVYLVFHGYKMIVHGFNLHSLWSLTFLTAGSYLFGMFFDKMMGNVWKYLVIFKDKI